MSQIIATKTVSQNLDYEQLCLKDPFLVFEKQYISRCVSIVDIVNSTFITAKLSPEQAGKYYMVFLNALSKIAQINGAKVIKNIGDSILFYFPEPDTQNNAEKALLCAQNMIIEIPKINLLLRKMNLPELRYRVSIDYGKIIVGKCKVSSSEDIFGSTVNLCAKMNKCTKPNSIIIGNDLYQLIKKNKWFNVKQVDHISGGFIQKYPLYVVEKN